MIEKNTEHHWIGDLQTRFPAEDFRHDTFFDATTRQILTTDMLVEGVHFDWAYTTPEDLGWKCLAVNLSDIAATGGHALWVTVSIGLPDTPDVLEKLNGIYAGLHLALNRFRCRLVGGDTVKSDKAVISVTVTGQLSSNAKPGRRTTALPEQVVAVSGPHGLSRGGLEVLQKKLEGYDQLKQAHLRPYPELKLGERLSQVLTDYAMMDSSDGLADALIQLAEKSHVQIKAERDRLPQNAELAKLAEVQNADLSDWMLYGGEDYKLVVCLAREAVSIFPELTVIGSVHALDSAVERPHVLWLEAGEWTTLSHASGFQHFSGVQKSKAHTPGDAPLL